MTFPESAARYDISWDVIVFCQTGMFCSINLDLIAVMICVLTVKTDPILGRMVGPKIKIVVEPLNMWGMSAFSSTGIHRQSLHDCN